MDYDPHLVDCRECEWSQPMPSRDTAEHQKRIHESENPGHVATVERVDEADLDQG